LRFFFRLHENVSQLADETTASDCNLEAMRLALGGLERNPGSIPRRPQNIAKKKPRSVAGSRRESPIEREIG
jgi:hypothetical protein